MKLRSKISLLVLSIFISSILLITYNQTINKKLNKMLGRDYYMFTDEGYRKVNNKIYDDGYKYVDNMRLINPKPMILNRNELIGVRDTLSNWMTKKYPTISKQTLNNIRETLKISDITHCKYIFTSYIHCFDEDVYLMKIKDTDDKIYRVYIIKYKTTEFCKETNACELYVKVRLEDEEWYRNFYETETEYQKNLY